MQGVAKLARGEGHVGLLDVPDPLPGPNQVVIEVQAAGICGTDLHILHDEFPTQPARHPGPRAGGRRGGWATGVATCASGSA